MNPALQTPCSAAYHTESLPLIPELLLCYSRFSAHREFHSHHSLIHLAEVAQDDTALVGVRQLTHMRSCKRFPPLWIGCPVLSTCQFLLARTGSRRANLPTPGGVICWKVGSEWACRDASSVSRARPISFPSSYSLAPVFRLFMFSYCEASQQVNSVVAYSHSTHLDAEDDRKCFPDPA